MRLRCGRNPFTARLTGEKPVLDRGGPRAATHHAAQARRGDKPRPYWRSRSDASGSRQARQGASMARTRGGVATAAPPRDEARRRGLPMAGAGGGGRRCGAGTAGAKAAWRAGSKMQGWLRSGPSGPDAFQTSRFAQDSRRRPTSWLPSRLRTRKSAVSKAEDRCPERSQALTRKQGYGERGALGVRDQGLGVSRWSSDVQGGETLGEFKAEFLLSHVPRRMSL